MRHSIRYLLPLCTAALLTAGCDAASRATGLEDAPPVPEAAVAGVLADTAAVTLAVALDDVLLRLLPGEAEEGRVRSAVQSLRAGLWTEDARGLSRSLASVRDAVAQEPMEPADGDALLLALDEIERAVAGSR